MNTELTKLLEQLPAADVRELLQSLYGLDKSVDSRIESRLLASDSTALAKHLKKRIAALKRGSRFISRGESGAFGRDMERLLDEIAALVPSDAKVAFALAEAYMGTHEKVLNRCDDSNGSIGDAYRFGVETWLQAAVAWQNSDIACKMDWQAELVKRHGDNAYAVWDYLISSSAALLSEEQLRQMAEQYEAEAVRLSERRQETSYCSETGLAKLGMRAVAVALGDVALYEQSYRCTGGEPHELQRDQIAKFCLAQGDGESALRCLEGEWSLGFIDRRDELMDQALLMLGRDEELLQLRQVAYEAEPSAHRLQALLAVVPPQEHEALINAGVLKAFSVDKIWIAVDTLFALGVPAAAADYLIEYPERLRDVQYNSLLNWAVRFEQEAQPLAATLCFRQLLLDVLDAARTKAYSHAANYYRALVRLDQRINNYHGMADAQAFERELRATHGQKRSFWSRLG